MKVLGRLAMAAALIVPVGIAAAPSAQATQGSGGHFNCTGAGTLQVRPGLLLNKSLDERLTGSAAGVTCTGGSVTGGSLAFNTNEEKMRCPSLRQGPAPKAGAGGVNGTARMIWNAGDHAGQTLITVNFLFTPTDGHITDGVISGTVRSGAVAVGKTVTGDFHLNKGLKSIPNGGNCSVRRLLTSAGITAISFKTS